MDSEYRANEFRELILLQGLDLNDSQIELLVCYFTSLFISNQTTNLTGYKTSADYIQYHLIDTFQICQLFDFTKVNSLMDVGTGCGVPGVIIKILYPHLDLALLETTRKKADFLEVWVKKHDLLQPNLIEIKSCNSTSMIQVINGRAEFVAHDQTFREQYDVVIARALAPLAVALELTTGFVRQNGVLLLPRGSGERIQTIEQTHHEIACDELSMSLKTIDPYQLPGRDESFYLYQYTKKEKLNEKYPRKPGIIKKRPL